MCSIEGDAAVRPDADRFDSAYCSNDCLIKAKTYSQSILFTLESPLPEHLIPEAASFSKDDRDRAQAAFAEYIKKSGKAAPELMARVIARQVSIETGQIMTSMGHSPLVDANVVLTDDGDYTFNDHLERLRYLDVAPFDEGGKLFKNLLQLAIPGLEHLATEERLSVYLGMMTYNAFGVCFEGGRNDKVGVRSPIMKTCLQYLVAATNGETRGCGKDAHTVWYPQTDWSWVLLAILLCGYFQAPMWKLKLTSHPCHTAQSLVRSIRSAMLQRYIRDASYCHPLSQGRRPSYCRICRRRPR